MYYSAKDNSNYIDVFMTIFDRTIFINYLSERNECKTMHKESDKQRIQS